MTALQARRVTNLLSLMIGTFCLSWQFGFLIGTGIACLVIFHKQVETA